MSLTERLVNLLSVRLAGTSVGRRSFLAGAAVVGSAVATHPWQYATRPLTAYASVCGTGAACNEGWSAFCCTITGANQCPPGSFVAGWWKADRSGFCCGSARYYIDCNASCGSTWKCHCASGTCDQRQVACNQFRYGQCHTEIDCYGPVVCRVITCTPPWQFDKACGTTSLTDNSTASHSAPCLPGTCPSVLDRFWYDHGGPGGAYGKSLAAERNGAAGSRYHELASATLYTVAGQPVQALRGPILDRYRLAGGPAGPLGYPSGRVVEASGYTSVTLQHGIILRSPTAGAHTLWGGFYTLWKQINGVSSGLGLPVSERENRPSGGLRVRFQHGVMYASAATGAHQLSGPVFSKWQALGGESSAIGLPIRNQHNITGRQVGTFQRGVITYTPATGARAVTGPILAKWRAAGGYSGALGVPSSDQLSIPGGRLSQAFSRSGIFYTPAHGAHLLTGTFWDKWRAIGGSGAGMGLPISDRVAGLGAIRVDFEDGGMYYSAATGTHWVEGALYQAFRANGWLTGLGLPKTDRYRVGSRLRIDFQRGSLVHDPATGKVVRL